MEKSEKFAFNLPSTESDDIVDVDLISYNFRVIDEKIPSNDDLKNINIEIDQTYSPESENAQSGKAVAEALNIVGDIETALDGIIAIQQSFIGGEAE